MPNIKKTKTISGLTDLLSGLKAFVDRSLSRKSDSLEDSVKTSKNIRGNYHTHTTMSDGVFTPEQVVLKAIDAGLDEIGITDHYFTFKGAINCIDDNQIDLYLQVINELKAKYSDRIKVLAGLEIDTSCFNTKRSKLPFDKLNKLDYVLFEYVEDHQMGELSKQGTIQIYINQQYTEATHNFLQQGFDPDNAAKKAKDYLQNSVPFQEQLRVLADRRGVFSLPELVEVRQHLTCKVGLAHPNITRNFCQYSPDVLAKILVDNNIFLDACATERNSTPEPYYTGTETWPFTPFFCNLGPFKNAFQKHGVSFAPSTDTHDIDNIGDIDKAQNKIDEYAFNKQQF